MRIHPESQSRRYLDWLENIRPWCISPPAVVGPPAPGLVPRRARPTSAPSRPRAKAGSATPTCSTPGSARRCGRSRRSAGREDTPELQAFYPTDVLLDGARHPLPVGRAHGDDGPASSPATSRSSDVYVHSVIQAPDGRRMSKSLGTGIDPLELIEGGRASSRLRRRRGALRPAGDVLHPGRALQRGEGRARARRWPTSCSTRRAILLRRRRGADAEPRARTTSRIAGSSAGCSTPTPRRTRAIELRLPQGRARALRLRLRRAVRLVPGAGQGARATTTDLQRHGCCTCCARRCALRHPVIPFVTEELWSHVPGADGLLAAQSRLPRAPASATLDAEARGRPRHRGRHGDPRAGATAAGVQARRGRCAGAARGLRGDARAVARLARLEPARRDGDGEPVATVPVAGRRGRAARERRRPRARPRASVEAQRERAARPRSSAPRASSPTRASSPRRREAVVAGRARQARAAARGAREPAAAVTAGLTRDAERYLLGARAVRHALRPGPHAPADDRARLAAGALRARSTSSARTASPRRRG